MKYSEWIDIWMDAYIRPKLRSNTIQRYDCTIKFVHRFLPSLLTMDILAIKNIHLQKALISLPSNYSKSYLKKIRSLFSLTFRRAFANGLIKEVPWIDLELPEAPEKDIEGLTVQEQEKLEAAAYDDKLGHIIFFFLYTGIRESELINLRWTEVNLKQGWIDVARSKTDAGVRRIPLLPQMVLLLLNLKQHSHFQDDFVFHTTSGTPISHSSLHKLYLRMRKATGIKTITNHVYRHTFATRAVEQGMDIAALSKILGHTDPSFTLKRYVHPDYIFLKKQMTVLNIKNTTKESQALTAFHSGISI